MNKSHDLPATPPVAAPLWLTILIIVTIVGAIVGIVYGNVFIGMVLFIAAIFMQTYSGFGTVHQVPGETRMRMGVFAFAWVLCVLLAAGAQTFVPAFEATLAAFGSDISELTKTSQRVYPAALLAPLLVALVWQFWPNRAARLRAATIVSWVSVVLIVLMMASMYLPILAIL